MRLGLGEKWRKKDLGMKIVVGENGRTIVNHHEEDETYSKRREVRKNMNKGKKSKKMKGISIKSKLYAF